MQFHFHGNQSHFHKNGFALRLALKQPGTRELGNSVPIPFYLSYHKPCGELALGENCIKIISQDKSLNSLGMFLETQTELLG